MELGGKMSKPEAKKEGGGGNRIVNALLPFIELSLLFVVAGLVVAFIFGGS